MRHSLFICLAWLGLRSPIARAGDCPTSHSTGQISARLQAAESALKALDGDGFSLAMEEVAIMLPCLSATPSPDLSAQLHRMRGLELYSARKEDAARHAIRAAKVLRPDFNFPDGFFPEGHALPDFWAAVPIDAPAHTSAPVPRDAAVSFDGLQTLDRPSDRATIFQRQSLSGAVQTTQYLMPKDPLPSYRSIPRQRNRLIAASIVTGVVAGSSYALGWQSRQRFMEDDAQHTRAELSRLKTRVNTSFIVSGVSATMTVAGLTWAVLIGPR
jgi:hypothetical protein